MTASYGQLLKFSVDSSEFSPVDYALLTMGYDDPILGEKIKGASTTALVLFQLAKAPTDAAADRIRGLFATIANPSDALRRKMADAGLL